MKQKSLYHKAKTSGVALESVVISGSTEEDDFLFVPQDIEESFSQANYLLNEVFELLLKFDEE